MGKEGFEICVTCIEPFEIFTDFQNELFGPFCALRQGRIRGIGLG